MHSSKSSILRGFNAIREKSRAVSILRSAEDKKQLKLTCTQLLLATSGGGRGGEEVDEDESCEGKRSASSRTQDEVNIISKWVRQSWPAKIIDQNCASLLAKSVEVQSMKSNDLIFLQGDKGKQRDSKL